MVLGLLATSHRLPNCLLELLRDQGRPPDIRNMDFILAMFPKSGHEVECTLTLETFVELVDREIILKHKELLVNSVIGVLRNKFEYTRRRAVPKVHFSLP